MAKIVIAENPSESLSQAGSITRFHEHGIATMGGDIAIPIESRGDHRGSGRHRLEQHHPEGFAPKRRGTKDVGRREAIDLVVIAEAAQPVDSGVPGMTLLEHGGFRTV